MSESLLAHLYSRIKGSQEDVATMSLQYILASSEKLLETFNRLLSDTLKTNIESVVSYSCQSVGENSERPDMSGINKDGNEVVLCEMKFYAGLTSNQPNGYISRLKTNGGKALVFVCPEQRRVTLWSKILDLCRDEGRAISEEDDRRANVDGISMAVVSWAEVIDTLRRVASSTEVEALPDIAQLSGFCNMMDSTAFIPFSSEDLGPEIARREERYYQVIDRLFDVLVSNKSINATGEGLKASATRNRYARYMKINDYPVALLYSRPTWMNPSSVETPFWFYVNDNDWNQPEEMRLKLRSIPERERDIIADKIAVALHPLLDVTLDEIANDMMNQILKVIALL